MPCPPPDVTTEESTESFEIVFVARQPVFDASQNLWGYELLFRSGNVSSAGVLDDDSATARVIIDGFSLASDGVDESASFLINFPSHHLEKHTPLALPPERVVVEVLETVQPTEEVLAALRLFKEKGYTLALDDFVGQPGFEPIIELADIVKVEVLGMTAEQVRAIAADLRPKVGTLLAEKVEDVEMFNTCRAAGFDLFQGYFFRRPEVLEGRTVSLSDMARFKLLQELTRDDFEVARLREIIENDVSLSYKLLRYINSSSVSMRHKVESLQQAIVLLGQSTLTHWLNVIMIMELAPNQRSLEVASQCIQRAQFMQALAREAAAPPHKPESMFLLGLFSLIDGLMGKPMAEVVNELPIEDDLRGALLGEETPALAWLQAVQALESGHVKPAHELAAHLGVPTARAATLWSNADAFARSLVTLAGEE